MGDPKKIGIVIARGLPPPDKMKDEEESDSETSDEEDSSGGGASALMEMMDALKAGDKQTAWDAFMDAVKMCKGSGPSY